MLENHTAKLESHVCRQKHGHNHHIFWERLCMLLLVKKIHQDPWKQLSLKMTWLWYFRSQSLSNTEMFHYDNFFNIKLCETFNRKLTNAHDPLLFFSFIFNSWRLITSQYCSGLCHTLTWISHGFTCVPHHDPPSRLPPHPIPLGLHSAPALSTCLMHPTWAGDLFHPW